MNSERQEAKKRYELWFAAQTEPRIRIIVALFGMERKLNSNPESVHVNVCSALYRHNYWSLANIPRIGNQSNTESGEIVQRAVRGQ